MSRALLAAALYWIVTACAQAQEWTRFRGPNGSGLGVGVFPARWTDKDYAWRVRLPGPGHSSPVLWSTRLFLTCGDDATGKRVVLAMDAGSGRTLWTRELAGAKHGKHADNSFASATPAVDERHVYVSFATPKEYLVVALDHDGAEKWRTDLGPFKAGHGFGASPIVHDDLVIVPNDQDGASFLAGLDRANGAVRWKTPRQGRSTYSTPCVFQPGRGQAQIIFTNYEHGITSLDPRTGAKNWETDVFSKGHIESSIGSPIVAGDLVIGGSGWLGVKKEVVAIRPAAPEKIIYR